MKKRERSTLGWQKPHSICTTSSYELRPRILEAIAMENKIELNNPRSSDQLHPFVYIALAGLFLWLVLSAWIFFFQGGCVELALAVISALIFIVISILAAIHHVGRRFQPVDQAPKPGQSWRSWISGDFDMRQGRRKGVGASIKILLPM